MSTTIIIESGPEKPCPVCKKQISIKAEMCMSCRRDLYRKAKKEAKASEEKTPITKITKEPKEKVPFTKEVFVGLIAVLLVIGLVIWGISLLF